MHRVLILGILFWTKLAFTQATGTPSSSYAPASVPPIEITAPSPTAPTSSSSADLPDAPSAIESKQDDVVAVGEASLKANGKTTTTCNAWKAMGLIYVDPNKVEIPPPACSELVYPYQRFLSTNVIVPLNWKQKGYLALHYTTDPAGLGTIAGVSAINIGVDSHTAYGPGLKGFGKLVGVSLLQDATGEFFGTFAVPSLTHQDPRYFRRPDKPIAKRILYSISRSYVSRSDTGKTIPNYGTLAAYPIVAELSNLYVPGIQSDGPSTGERIITGLALDPVNNLVNEFLPDFAKRIHVRVIFVQQILNNIAVSPSTMP